MSSAWSAEVLVPALRQSLRDGPVTNRGFQLDEVWAEQDEILAAFRWFRDPNRYAVRFPMPTWVSHTPEHADHAGTQPESPWTGLPVESATEWAQDVAWLLEEELSTGAVLWAQRRRRNDVVELDWRHARISRPVGHHSSSVILPEHLGRLSLLRPFADFGRELARRGLDVSTPRAQHRRGRLLGWFRLNTDDDVVKPVGHVAVARHPELADTATLDVLDLVSAAPDTAAPYLAHLAIQAAAEFGARIVQGTCAHPRLPEVGFSRRKPDEPPTVDTTTLTWEP